MTEEALAAGMIRRVLLDELAGREIPSEEMMTYLVFSIYSRIFCYGMMLKDEKYQNAEHRESIRSLVCQGVCREVEEAL